MIVSCSSKAKSTLFSKSTQVASSVPPPALAKSVSSDVAESSCAATASALSEVDPDTHAAPRKKASATTRPIAPRF